MNIVDTIMCKLFTLIGISFLYEVLKDKYLINKGDNHEQRKRN